MSIRTNFVAILLTLNSISDAAQTVNFWSAQGDSTDVNAALFGGTVFDHLGGSNYSGYIGEMALIPTEPGILSDAAPGARGMASMDGDGLYGGARGFVGFCIDSETPFLTSSSLSDTFDYQPLSFAAANSRFQADGVNFYISGSLKRAAYMIETFYDDARAAGELGGASLQAGIWEVLYDANPSVSSESGNYYIRNNIGLTQQQNDSNAIIALVNSWFTQAESDNWGGTDYAPDDSVIFWVNSENSQTNQSIISLRVEGTPLISVPEAGSSIMLLGSLSLLMMNRRRPR
ncbi:hypothetical protein [Haloferula sp.]|uniref:hypothetical protein n=1 Tax=Haloferula sp. TaxID=2497595 RepID=UPI003C73161C